MGVVLFVFGLILYVDNDNFEVSLLYNIDSIIVNTQMATSTLASLPY